MTHAADCFSQFGGEPWARAAALRARARASPTSALLEEIHAFTRAAPGRFGGPRPRSPLFNSSSPEPGGARARRATSAPPSWRCCASSRAMATRSSRRSRGAAATLAAERRLRLSGPAAARGRGLDRGIEEADGASCSSRTRAQVRGRAPDELARPGPQSQTPRPGGAVALRDRAPSRRHRPGRPGGSEAQIAKAAGSLETQVALPDPRRGGRPRFRRQGLIRPTTARSTAPTRTTPVRTAGQRRDRQPHHEDA